MQTGSDMKRPLAGAVIGLLYGSALLYLAFFAAGAGQGTSIPLLMSSAPLGALGDRVALMSIPALWTLLGVLVALSDSPGARKLARATLLLHYLSGLALVAVQGDLHYLMRLYAGKADFLAGWIVLYVVGQVIAWEYMRPQQALR